MLLELCIKRIGHRQKIVPKKLTVKKNFNVQVQDNFLADLNDRIKTSMKPIFSFGKQAKNYTSCTTSLAKSIKKNWGEMLKQNRNKSLKDLMENAKSVLEHSYDCHVKCDSSWCYCKRAQEEEKKYHPEEGHKFYSKTKDSKLYLQLKGIIDSVDTEENMKQSLHPYDSNSNESLNKSVTRYAPKHKNLSSSQTLFVRIVITVEVYNMEFLNYWSTVCELCHFHDDKLIEYLTYVERQDRLKKQRQRTSEAKRKRVYKWQSKLKDEIYKERTCKESGLYYESCKSINLSQMKH